jgi:hypothetical protein
MSDRFDPDKLLEVSNPPGHSGIRYQTAAYGLLREGMLRKVARDREYLRDLNTRDPADPTIALIDSWAIGGDVLGFYAERIANESFLQTATERRSIRSLARLIDYELRPGKAAETWLAFTLEDAPGAPDEVAIPTGVRVGSIPGPGETMVNFETVEDITGRPQLNAMRPRLTREQSLDDVLAARWARCTGLLNDVRRGDWLLTNTGSAQDLKRVETATTKPAEGVTEIAIEQDPVLPLIFFTPMMAMTTNLSRISGASLTPSLFDMHVHGVLRDQPSFEAEMLTNRISVLDVARHLNFRPIPSAPPESAAGFYRFRTRAAVFNHNAVDPSVAPSMGDSAASRMLALDSEVPELRPNGWMALSEAGGTHFIARVTGVETVTMTSGKFSARVTRVRFDRDLPSNWRSVSATEVTVLIDSRQLGLAPLPVTEDVSGSSLTLNAYYPGLRAGRPVAVSGERADLPGVLETELHMIKQVLLEDGYTRLDLETAITGPFRRDSVTINGNTARATHGETGSQPLGHGDASRANQRFRIPIIPLTHVGAATASGVVAALTIRADGVLWHEVASLRDAGPLDRVYALSYGEDGSVWVQFGDGRNGRRLATGINNVVAAWRKGLGSSGMVRAGQLSLLSGAPQGVKGVSNPLPANGAADGETLEEARANAPLSVMTLGRIVTLQDYEDFARSFTGVAKAHAIWAYVGTSRAVYLTVAGIGGAVLSDRDIGHLRQAITDASDTAIALSINPHVPAWFKIEANLKILPDYVADDVVRTVETLLRDSFSFEKRQLGQPVARSEVIAAIQSVEGIDWVDLDSFYRDDTPDNAAVLTAALPRSGRRTDASHVPEAAELLCIYPGAMTLRVLP